MMGVGSLDDLRGRVLSLSRDQFGCRLLQSVLESRLEGALDLMLTELQLHLVQLMVEPFGNYLFQKLLSVATVSKVTQILQATTSHLVAAARHVNGTRSIQTAIEKCSIPLHVDLVMRVLQPSVVNLSLDSNGTHVVQKCLQRFPNKTKRAIILRVIERLVPVAMQRHGCCVVQRCFDAAPPALRSRIVSVVTKHAVVLMQDAFANYVVQYLLKHSARHHVSAIIATLFNSIARLSQQKYSSNVVETCLAIASAEERTKIIKEMAEPDTMRVLLYHQYGNYAVQRALLVCDDKQRHLLIDAVRPNVRGLLHNVSGRRIIEKIQNYYPDVDLGLPGMRVAPDGINVSTS